MSTCRRKKLDLNFWPCTKINSKWIKACNTRSKTLKELVEPKYCFVLHLCRYRIWIGFWLLRKEEWELTNQNFLFLRELKKLLNSKGHTYQIKKQLRPWEKLVLKMLFFNWLFFCGVGNQNSQYKTKCFKSDSGAFKK